MEKAGNGVREYIAEKDKLEVKYTGRTIDGSLTEGRTYDAGYFTKETDTGTIKRNKNFAIRDDSGYYCSYDNSMFEILWRATDGTPKPQEGYFPPDGRQ